MRELLPGPGTARTGSTGPGRAPAFEVDSQSPACTRDACATIAPWDLGLACGAAVPAASWVLPHSNPCKGRDIDEGQSGEERHRDRVFRVLHCSVLWSSRELPVYMEGL